MDALTLLVACLSEGLGLVHDRGSDAIVPAVARKLTVLAGVVLALVFAGCGKDESSKTTAQSAATTTPATTTSATTTSGSEASGSTTTTSKASGSKSGSSKGSGSTTTTTSGGSKSSSSKTSTTKKSGSQTTTTAKKPVGVTPGTATATGTSSGGADLTSGTGSGPISERLQVVGVLRRYYKAFLDKDGDTACALLTPEGRGIMVADSGAKTCADSVALLVKAGGTDNTALLVRTRNGLHVDDVTVTGNNATAQIGKQSKLRLDGRWLLRSPNVVNG